MVRFEVAARQRTDSTSTNALLHLPVRTQIQAAQLDSIRSTGLGAIAATQGWSSSPAAGLTCQCVFESASIGQRMELVADMLDRYTRPAPGR